MCGIAGSINFSFNKQKLFEELRHRGPDEQNGFETPALQLHHFRLAILDIAGGQQPMKYGPYMIIFNGEIYNHQEVRKKFNFLCSSNSDTETILQAYAKLGPACLNEFDGMFAIAIYDEQKQELFLARDRAGKKPLYYFTDGTKFLFASELNVLQQQLPLSIHEEHIKQYIRMGYFYKSYTPFNNVYELQAGHYAYIPLQKPDVTITKWWDIHPYYLRHSKDDFETSLEKVDTILHQAVKNRVQSSDLEVGSFLSGGIDSGLVTAIAKQYNPSLKTFTVSFDGEYDEAPLAKMVAEKHHTEHHEIKISFNNLTNDIEKIIANYGEPFSDSSSIPSYYVSKVAKEQLTVILNGDGGDELFGGYRRYVPFAKYDFFKTKGVAKGAASLLHSILPPSNNKKSNYNYFYRLIDLASKNSIATYLSSTFDNFEGYEKFLENGDSYLKEVSKDFDAINNSKLSGLQKIMNLDFDNILAGNLLVKMDIATMAHSLEGRSPLLCKELLEYVPSINDSFKIRGTQTKYILRQLAVKYLPDALINQPKRGFEVPLKKWMDNELKEIVFSYLGSANSYANNFVDKKFIQQLLDKKLKISDEKRAKMLYTLFALNVWHKKCFKNGS